MSRPSSPAASSSGSPSPAPWSTEPAILLADEPTGNLDSRTTVEVMAVFQALNEQGITVVLVTHEPEVAHYAKRIIEIRDGLILRDEPVTQRQRAAEDLDHWHGREPYDNAQRAGSQP